MKISEVIERLEALRAEHGDVEVGSLNHEYGESHPSEIAVKEWWPADYLELKPKYVQFA